MIPREKGPLLTHCESHTRARAESLQALAPIRVMLAQVASPDHESMHDRIARVEAWLDAALAERSAEDRPQLVVLPELWAAGFFNMDCHREVAEPFHGPSLAFAQRFARRHGVWVHLGSFLERLARDPRQEGVGVADRGVADEPDASTIAGSCAVRPAEAGSRAVRPAEAGSRAVRPAEAGSTGSPADAGSTGSTGTSNPLGAVGIHLANTTVIVTAAGEVAHVYRKIHAFGYRSLETELVSTGRELPVTETPIGRTGTLICYDLRFGEVWGELRERGADAVVLPAAWPELRRTHWDALTQARAIEQQAWVLACGGVGEQRGTVLSGHSRVIDPLGNILVEAPPNTEALIETEIDVDLVARWRAEFPVSDDRLGDYAGLGDSGSASGAATVPPAGHRESAHPNPGERA